MNPRISLFLFVVLAVLVISAGCTSVQRQKVYSCPSCKAVVPSSATMCPNCGQRLMAVTAAGRGTPAAGAARGAGTPPSVAQAPSTGGDSKFPPVKVGALLEITDSNHQRVAPFVSIEVYKVVQAADDPVIAFDVGIAEDAIFGTAGVRGFMKEAPNFGVFFFCMLDFRRTLKPRLYGPHQPHFCSGIGVTIGGF